MCGTLEYSWPNEQHSAVFYVLWAAVFPLLLAGYSRARKLRYPATAAALVATLLWFAMGQVLSHVGAVPRLAPIWNPRTYLWPPYFPVLLGDPCVRHGSRPTSIRRPRAVASFRRRSP